MRRGRPTRWTGEAVPPVVPNDPIVAERVKAAWQMTYDGMILEDVAKVLGVKRSTVSQYLNDPDGTRLLERKHGYAGKCIDCGAPTTGTANGLDRVPERCTPCHQARIKECVVCRIDLGNRQRGTGMVWTDKQIFAAIRSCIGDDGKATANRYQKCYAATPKGSMPSLPTIVKRFDTWIKACDAGGIPHGVAVRKFTRTTRDQCLDAVQIVVDELGRVPTYDEYAERAKPLGLPSAITVRNRVGSWTKVLKRLHKPEQEQAAA